MMPGRRERGGLRRCVSDRGFGATVSRALVVTPNCTFESEMSPEAIRLRASAANPIVRILSRVSSWVETAAAARRSSTTPDEGNVTSACRRSREDEEKTTACTVVRVGHVVGAVKQSKLSRDGSRPQAQGRERVSPQAMLSPSRSE